MSDLSSRQVRAVASLLDGRSIREAARDARVNEKTVARWLENPDFLAQLKEGQVHILHGVGLRLSGMTTRALDCLQEILDGSGAQPGANVKRLAANDVLSLLEKYIQLYDLEERISRLEGLYDKR